METVNRSISEWFVRVYSVELLLVCLTLIGVLRYLAKNRETLSDRRFVSVSVVAGLLGVLLVGAGYRTPIVAWLLDLPAGAMVYRSLNWIKAMLALTAAALSVYETARIAARKPPRKCWSKGAALALAVMSLAAYFSFGDVGYADFYHRHEFFHYYLGSKYPRELGYKRLYLCTAVAQTELGQGNEVRARKIMDLAVDRIVPGRTALEHPDECRSRFTPERWDAFKSDVRFLRQSSNLEYWNGMQTDHGYNPPPVWTALGHFWSSMHAPSLAYFKFLASLDLMFWVGIFAAIGWAFGWRVFCVAAIFFGCQVPGEYFWTGGAFRRQDWLFGLVLSACLVRKRYYALGGAALAYSTLLRVFPGVLLAGWAVVVGTHAWKHKRWAPHHVRLIMGGVAAAVVLVSLSIGVAGWRAYPEFYQHIQLHKQTPVTNNMGLETLLSHSYAGRMEFVRDEKKVDPFAQWVAMRRDRLHAFRPLHVVLLIALGFVFVKVVRRVKSLWIALALSLAVVISVVETTCYYYSMFILAALLSRHRRGVEAWVLCVTGVSQLLAVNRFLSYFYDDLYTTQSVLFCGFALSLLFAYWPPANQARALASSSAENC
ncbi:MAG TPA: hypothetical protein VK550_15190 [Polyangiaceae bacterium]|nr:hypothetical protein [Polyangiaceae bacterium]